MTGFEVGEIYRIDMYVTNLGFTGGSDWRGEDGVIEVFDGFAKLGTSHVLTKPATASDPIVWEEASVEFSTTSASIDLIIGAETLGGIGEVAFLGVDGVSIALVPAPGGLAMVGVGGLMAGRRRR